MEKFDIDYLKKNIALPTKENTVNNKSGKHSKTCEMEITSII